MKIINNKGNALGAWCALGVAFYHSLAQALSGNKKHNNNNNNTSYKFILKIRFLILRGTASFEHWFVVVGLGKVLGVLFSVTN